jgi:hypothetical protein
MAAEHLALVVEEEGGASADEPGQRGRTSATIWSGVESLTRSGIASRQRSPSSRRQMKRTMLGGESPSGKANALPRIKPEVASSTLALASASPPASRSAIAISSAAMLSIRIRCRATLGWPRPARQRATATRTESTVQSTRSAIR